MSTSRFEIAADDQNLLSESGKLRSWWTNDTPGADLFLSSSNRANDERRSAARTRKLLLLLGVVTAVSLALSVIAMAGAYGQQHTATSPQAGASTSSSPAAAAQWPDQIRRIAFGSCTSYDLRPQPIWTQGVIPAAPDAWVWLGDMAYFDDPLVDCKLVPGFPECNCTADWMRWPPFQCNAGNPVHARQRMAFQLSSPEYLAFLSYMCPGHEQRGVFPPLGTNPDSCPRPIFGVWDDHDFGWNNGNGRNPAKYEMKEIYLDGIGEARDSPRRSSTDGMQARYTLPGLPGLPGSTGSSSQLDGGNSDSNSDGGLVDEIQLVLLDERYFRQTLPCSARAASCQAVLQRAAAATAGGPGTARPDAGSVAFCSDFLGDGQLGSTGSCCKKDDEWSEWCSKPASRASAYFQQLCDPTSATFAQQQLLLDADNVTVLPISGGMWHSRQTLPHAAQRLVEAVSSPICEVLGLRQRRWLQQTLADSRAALKVIASGSVLAGNLGFKEAYNESCSGDDLACWPRAQVNLLHTLANASGCVIVITGDFHYSDLKVIQPGPGSAYAERLQTQSLAKPVYQAMSSGLTDSTADGNPANPCSGSFREDLVGLRPLGRCSYVSEPAFSLLEVDWEQRIVTLSVRNHSTGAVASGYDGSRQQLQLSLDTCKLL